MSTQLALWSLSIKYWALCVLLAFSLLGCSLGPYALRTERALYNVTMQASSNEQLLLNLVRLKYREPTFFLEVGSISANFNYSIAADVTRIFPEGTGKSFHASGGGRYAENPTITYTPLQGEQFAKRLMAEMDVKTFLLLLRAGWNPARLMRATVERIGHLRNDPSAQNRPDDAESTYHQFLRLTEMLARLKNKGVVRFALQPSKGVKIGATPLKETLKPADIIAADKDQYELVQTKDGIVEVYRAGRPALLIEAEPSEQDKAEVVECLRLLKCPTHKETAEPQIIIFHVNWGGAQPPEHIEVPLLLRSFLDVLYYFAQGIEVPKSHIEKGIVKTRWHVTTDGKSVEWNVWRNATKDMLDIRSCPFPPRHALVATKYRDHWFYIDDTDIHSKDTFALLCLIFALQAGEVPTPLPLLTIPITGR